jgi:hypothetical protein
MRSVITKLLFFGFVSQALSQKLLVCQVSGDTCTFHGKIVNKGESVVTVADHQGSTNADIRNVVFESSSIYSIPSELFTTFRNLETLDMVNQGVREIRPGTFKNAKSLNNLYLQLNNFEAFNENTFEGAEHLRKLSCVNSGITSFHKDTFAKLVYIEYLDLGKNQVKIFHKDIFKSLVNLETLSISHNPFEFLHKSIFRNNLELVHLNMMGANKLGGLSNRMFSHLTKLDRLYLSGIGCINKEYNPNAYSQIQTIENELRNCLIHYLSYENDEIIDKIDNLQSSIEKLLSKRTDL